MKIIKLKTAEISEASFSDTTIHRGERLNRDSVLDLRNHFKPTETFQFTLYVTCHPAGAKKALLKGKSHDYYYSEHERLSKLNLLPLQYHREINDAVYFFKCLKNKWLRIYESHIFELRIET